MKRVFITVFIFGVLGYLVTPKIAHAGLLSNLFGNGTVLGERTKPVRDDKKPTYQQAALAACRQNVKNTIAQYNKTNKKKASTKLKSLFNNKKIDSSAQLQIAEAGEIVGISQIPSSLEDLYSCLPDYDKELKALVQEQIKINAAMSENDQKILKYMTDHNLNYCGGSASEWIFSNP